jgi:hypothetical protein
MSLNREYDVERDEEDGDAKLVACSVQAALGCRLMGQHEQHVQPDSETVAGQEPL